LHYLHKKSNDNILKINVITSNKHNTKLDTSTLTIQKGTNNSVDSQFTRKPNLFMTQKFKYNVRE